MAEATECVSLVSPTEPEHLCCPVTRGLFRDPVFVPESGTTYEREALKSFWATLATARGAEEENAGGEAMGRGHAARPRRLRDPFTNRLLRSTRVYTNWDKRREVQAFLSEHPDFVPPGWDGHDVPPPAEGSESSTGNSGSESDDAHGDVIVGKDHRKRRRGRARWRNQHRRNRSFFSAAEAAEWAADLVLGQPGQADDWEDDDNVRDENLSAHRAAAALLVVMSAALIGVLHPLEAVRDGTDTRGFDVDAYGAAAGAADVSSVYMVAPGGVLESGLPRGELVPLPRRFNLEVDHSQTYGNGTMRLVALPRDPTPATGALVGLSAAWLLTVAAWTWSSLDGGAPLLFVAFAAPFWAAGASLATAAGTEAASVSGATATLTVAMDRATGGSAQVAWEVAGVEVYERSVELGAHPEVHAVPGMVEVRSSGSSVADAVTFATGRVDEHKQIVKVVQAFLEAVAAESELEGVHEGFCQHEHAPLGECPV